MKDILLVFGFFVFFSNANSFMRNVYDEPKSYWLSRRCINGTKSYTRCCKKIPNWTFGYLPNPGNCRTYYKCNADKFELKRCHYNYIWNRTLQKCMKPETTDCVDNKSTGKKENDKIANIDGTEMIGNEKDVDVDSNGSIVEKIDVNKTVDVDEKKIDGNVNGTDAVKKNEKGNEHQIDEKDRRVVGVKDEKGANEKDRRVELKKNEQGDEMINDGGKQSGDGNGKNEDHQSEKNGKDLRSDRNEKKEKDRRIDRNENNIQNEIEVDERVGGKKIAKSNEKQTDGNDKNVNEKKIHGSDKFIKSRDRLVYADEKPGKESDYVKTKFEKYKKDDESDARKTDENLKSTVKTETGKSKSKTVTAGNETENDERPAVTQRSSTTKTSDEKKTAIEEAVKIKKTKTKMSTKTDIKINEIDSPYKINGKKMVIIEIVAPAKTDSKKTEPNKTDLPLKTDDQKIATDLTSKIDDIKKMVAVEIDSSTKATEEQKKTTTDTDLDAKVTTTRPAKMKTETNSVQTTDDKTMTTEADLIKKTTTESVIQTTDDNRKTLKTKTGSVHKIHRNKNILKTKTDETEKPMKTESDLVQKTEDDERIVETKTGPVSKNYDKTTTAEVSLSAPTDASADEDAEIDGITEIDDDQKITTIKMRRFSKMGTRAESDDYSTQGLKTIFKTTTQIPKTERPTVSITAETYSTEASASFTTTETSTVTPETRPPEYPRKKIGVSSKPSLTRKPSTPINISRTLTKQYGNSTKISLTLTKIYEGSTKTSEASSKTHVTSGASTKTPGFKTIESEIEIFNKTFEDSTKTSDTPSKPTGTVEDSIRVPKTSTKIFENLTKLSPASNVTFATTPKMTLKKSTQITDPEVLEASAQVYSKVESPVNQSCLEGKVDPFICCRGVSSDILLSYPPHENLYIQCVDQQPILKHCPEGYFWNLTLHRCD